MADTARANQDKATDKKWEAYLQKFKGYDQDAEDAMDAKALLDKTMYIDKDNYEFFVRMKAKGGIMKYGGFLVTYAIILVFCYFVFTHFMAMTPDSEYERPSWAILYIPMVLLVFYKTFTGLSLVKMSF